MNRMCLPIRHKFISFIHSTLYLNGGRVRGPQIHLNLRRAISFRVKLFALSRGGRTLEGAGGGLDRVINGGRLQPPTLEGPKTSSRGGPIMVFPLFLAQPGGPRGGRLQPPTLEGPKTSLSWAPPQAFQCASSPVGNTVTMQWLAQRP